MNKYLNIFSFVSVVGTLAWVSTELHGGMAIHILMYWWLIIPVMLGFVVTFMVTISRVIQHGFKNVLFSSITHLFGITMLTIFSFYNSEVFKSETILEAILIDDLSSITIKLRADNTFETITDGAFGYVDRISGEYELKQDTIIFRDPPYSNDFIPNSIIIDKSDSALYFNKLKNGEFDRTKSFVNYFEIRKIKI